MESCYITQVALLSTVLRLFFMKWPIKDAYHKPLIVHFVQMCPFLLFLSLATPSDQIAIAMSELDGTKDIWGLNYCIAEA